jgi:hypothetical protein
MAATPRRYDRRRFISATIGFDLCAALNFTVSENARACQIHSAFDEFWSATAV